MKTNMRHRDVRFYHEDGCLMRTVVGYDGRTYTQRCSRQTFETVAYAIEETPAEGEGTTLQFIARGEDLPFTQVNIALEFLKERGIATVRHRRCYPATSSAHLDAMVEFYALAEAPAFNCPAQSSGGDEASRSGAIGLQPEGP